MSLGVQAGRAADAAKPWHRRLGAVAGSLALHVLPFIVLALALQTKPQALEGRFGQAVSITLVSSAPASAASAAARAPTPSPSLSNLERRLSEVGPTVAESNARPPQPSTSLSDLFDSKAPMVSGTERTAAPIVGSGTGDDPFSRASVSYRGDDPAKAARLRARAQACVGGAKSLRVLLIINADGYLVTRPRPVGAGSPAKGLEPVLRAIERCAPFADAATPGAPRSYEIEVG